MKILFLKSTSKLTLLSSWSCCEWQIGAQYFVIHIHFSLSNQFQKYKIKIALHFKCPVSLVKQKHVFGWLLQVTLMAIGNISHLKILLLHEAFPKNMKYWHLPLAPVYGSLRLCEPAVYYAFLLLHSSFLSNKLHMLLVPVKQKIWLVRVHSVSFSV